MALPGVVFAPHDQICYVALFSSAAPAANQLASIASKPVGYTNSSGKRCAAAAADVSALGNAIDELFLLAVARAVAATGEFDFEGDHIQLIPTSFKPEWAFRRDRYTCRVLRSRSAACVLFGGLPTFLSRRTLLLSRIFSFPFCQKLPSALY